MRVQRKPNMRFNIRGHHTAHSESDICKHCRHCIRTSGQKLHEEISHCQIHDRNIHFQVSECSSFESKTAMTKFEMTQIAWKVGLDKKTQKIGFYSPSDYKKNRLNKDSKIEFPTPNPDDDDIFA